MKINPFRPNSPCKPGMFVGRYDQIKKIENCLLLTRANRAVSFLLTGERGIGKTSLLTLIKYFAEGEIEVNKQKLNFLVIETDIDPRTTQSGLIKKIEIGLRRKLAKSEKTRNFFKESWSFIKNLEVAGTKFNSNSNTDLEVFFEEFSYSLADTINRITENKDNLFDSKYDGVLIMLDETDHASEELNLGSFIKILLERIQKEGCEKLMFGVAGLPETREILYQSHPSSLRVFEELELDRLSKTESKEVLNNCKNEYKSLNISELDMVKEAESLLIHVSEGFPHFIHQYGFCAFEVSNGKKITRDNVLKGATGKKGAIAMLGNKYYRDDYYNKIRGDSYREVLNIMSQKLDDWITKDEIRKKYTGTESQLSNALKALIDRKIILPKAGVRGEYRLQDKGFAWWIMLTCQQEE